MKQAFFHALSLCGQIVRRESKGQRMVKMFYLCKLVTVFGRVTAISRICFVCRVSCQAIELKPLLRGQGFLDTMRHTPLRRPPPLVASINTSIGSRTAHHSTSIPRIRDGTPGVPLAPEPDFRGWSQVLA